MVPNRPQLITAASSSFSWMPVSLSLFVFFITVSPCYLSIYLSIYLSHTNIITNTPIRSTRRCGWDRWIYCAMTSSRLTTTSPRSPSWTPYIQSRTTSCPRCTAEQVTTHSMGRLLCWHSIVDAVCGCKRFLTFDGYFFCVFLLNLFFHWVLSICLFYDPVFLPLLLDPIFAAI